MLARIRRKYSIKKANVERRLCLSAAERGRKTAQLPSMLIHRGEISPAGNTTLDSGHDEGATFRRRVNERRGPFSR